MATIREKAQDAPSIKRVVPVKREKWGNKFVYTARQRGKLITWSNVKGSKLTIIDAKEVFKRKGSFDPKAPKIERIFLKNVIETTVFGRKPPKVRNSQLQAVAAGYINGKFIKRSSGKIGTDLGLRNKKDAIEHAKDNFYATVAAMHGHDSDPVIGRELWGEDRPIQIYWKYYSRR